MLLINRASLLSLFIMDLLADYPGPNYEDTREFYSVRSLNKADNDSSFIKLAFVVDQNMYSAMDNGSNEINRHCQEMLMIANSLFQPYNIFIALVDITIWVGGDEIEIDSSNITVTHTRFETYARDFFTNNHTIDHVLLLSLKLQLYDSFEFSPFEKMDKQCKLSTGVIGSGYSTDLNAARLIILLGRSMGMAIDEDIRKCFEPMNINYEWELYQYLRNPIKYVKKHCIDKLMYKIDETRINFSCLKTKPYILYKKPVCGNNVTEPGEQCDCRWLNWRLQGNLECDNQCCDAITCHHKETYSNNYPCAFGECCNLNKCSVKRKKDKIICRLASHPCDVAEYCDGEAAFCPNDKFVHDGGECSVRKCHIDCVYNGEVFCQGTTEHKGVCNSNGLCRYKKKMFFPTCKTNITDSSPTIYTDTSSTSLTNSPNVHSYSSQNTFATTYSSPDSQLDKSIIIDSKCDEGMVAICDFMNNDVICKCAEKVPSKCNCLDSPFLDFFQWKTYFYLTIVLGLIGIIFSSRIKKHYRRLRNGIIKRNYYITVNQSLTATTHDSFQMDSLDDREHEYNESNTAEF